MTVKIEFICNDSDNQKKLVKKIHDILRNSYDYQHEDLEFEEYDSIYFGYPPTYELTLYTEFCRQPKRTLQTLREIEELIMNYV